MSGSKDILIEQLRERAEKAERFNAYLLGETVYALMQNEEEISDKVAEEIVETLMDTLIEPWLGLNKEQIERCRVIIPERLPRAILWMGQLTRRLAMEEEEKKKLAAERDEAIAEAEAHNAAATQYEKDIATLRAERDEARAEREREERLEALGRAIVEASRFFQDADDIALSEDVTIWEDDCHGGDHRTVLIMDDNQHALLADVSEAVATYREETAGVDVRSDEIKELRKRAEKAERERDEARAERDALHVALELAEVEVALDRSWCRICRTECRGAHRGRREHMHAAECVLNIRAHAAKVKP